MKKHCEKHDCDYESRVRVVGGAELEAGMCPECAREVNEAIHREGMKQNAEAHRVVDIETKRRSQAEKFDRVGIPPRFQSKGFGNYQTQITGQKDALRRCKAYSGRICAGGYGGLILSGDPGTGKTHLACAIGMDYQRLGKSVLFFTVAELIRKLRECYRKNSETNLQQAINAFRDVDLLILDEVGFQTGSDDEILLLTDVINARYGWMKPTVLISNLSVSRLEEVIGLRIIDRMREDGGALIEFKWRSFRVNDGKPKDA